MRMYKEGLYRYMGFVHTDHVDKLGVVGFVVEWRGGGGYVCVVYCGQSGARSEAKKGDAG